MDTDKARVRRLFDEAAELAPAERAALLDRECGGNRALREHVEALLNSLDEVGDFLAPSEPAAIPESRAWEMASATAPHEAAGTRIGPYKLLQQIGEGGFGVVFLAEQQTPVVRRVALKIIKLGMDTRQVIARFEAERQALALMDHPNIAKVLDAGATEAGRPYFVMELVRGEPITAYCDRKHLSTPERLALFIDVCHAIQHAHQKGIIHRDIKPTNILVTVADGRAIPKVIDFGIAKAMIARLTEKTLFTEHRQLIGTPEYMSPEQAEMSAADIDTRSDVYSLGVLLYEILTGTTPLDGRKLRSAAWDEMLRMIREGDTPRPSTRVSGMQIDVATVAAQRRTEPTRLARLLRGDLDWIAMRCLEKDRTRRYETANELAMDVQRHLAGEPVTAAPPRTGYRLRKFVRRHKLGVTAGVAIGAALVLGAAAASVGLVRAERQRALAEKQKNRANALIAFVTNALRSSDSVRGGAPDITVADAMLRAVKDIDAGAFGDDPDVQSGVLDTIGQILNGNGRSNEALPLVERALEIRRRVHPGDNVDVAVTLHTVAWVRESLGRLAEAEPLFAECLDMRRRLVKEDHTEVAQSLNSLGRVREGLGRVEEAEPLLREAAEMYQRLYPGDSANVSASLSALAILQVQEGRAEKAEPLLVRALDMDRRLYKGDDARLATGLDNLGCARKDLGRFADAEDLFVQAIEMNRRLYKGDHPSIASNLVGLASVRSNLGHAAEAEPLLVQALEMRQRLFKGDHPDVAESLTHLGQMRRRLGQDAEAEPLLAQALEMYRRLFPADHPGVASAMIDLAGTWTSLGRAAEAEPLAEQALAMRLRLHKGDHAGVSESLNALAYVRMNLGRGAEAEALFEQALEMDRRLRKGDHADLVSGLANLATVRTRSLGRPKDAEPLLEEAVAMARRLYAGDHPLLALVIHNLGSLRRNLGRLEDTEVLYREALEMNRRLYKGDHPAVADDLETLALVLHERGRDAEAEPLYRESLDMCRRLYPTPDPLTARVLHDLADSLRAQGRLADAEPPVREAMALYEQHPDWPLDDHVYAADILMQILAGRDQPVEAGDVLRDELAFQRRLAPKDEATVASIMARFGALVLKAPTPQVAARAEPFLRECLEIRARLYPEGHADSWLRCNAMSMLGGALVVQAEDSSLELEDRVARLNEAEPLLLAAYAGLKDDPRVPTPAQAGGADRKREALGRIVHLYQIRHAAEPGKGYDAKAAPWRAQLDATPQQPPSGR